MRVALFATCLADVFEPEIPVSIVRVLRRYGVDVTFPEAQTCCGQPAFNTGNRPEAKAAAARMIDVFDGDDMIVSPSASCTAMVREQYPVLFADDPPMLERAHALASRTYEFVEFLAKVLKVEDPDAEFNGTATYHYTCHQRPLGLTTEAEDLIRKLRGVTYVPLERRDRCCGFGGAFAVKEPEVSGEMVRDKVECIIRTGADAVIVNDTGCIINIAGALNKRRVPIRVVHLARILAGEVTGP